MPFDPKYTYLLLDLGTLIFPLLLSFDRKVAFYTHWWRLFPAIGVAGAVFIIWDHFFTVANYTFEAAGQQWTGIWNFNPEYLTGIYIASLPIEEWLFFLVVPYACVFIYEVLKAYFPNDRLAPYGNNITLFFGGFSMVLAIMNYEQWYTVTTFGGLAILLYGSYMRKVPYMSRFFGMYIVQLIPFFLVNGVLTGLPVVVYNNAENLGIRIGTVPAEDSFYSMFLLLLTITVYEYLNRYSRTARA